MEMHGYNLRATLAGMAASHEEQIERIAHDRKKAEQQNAEYAALIHQWEKRNMLNLKVLVVGSDGSEEQNSLARVLEELLKTNMEDYISGEAFDVDEATPIMAGFAGNMGGAALDSQDSIGAEISAGIDRLFAGGFMSASPAARDGFNDDGPVPQPEVTPDSLYHARIAAMAILDGDQQTAPVALLAARNAHALVSTIEWEGMDWLVECATCASATIVERMELACAVIDAALVAE
jgi:hypothetical protein